MAETLITINMRRFLLNQARNKRFVRAAGYVRESVAKRMRLSPGNVRLSMELNNMIMKHYSKSMRKLKLSISLENGIATAKPFERSIITRSAAAKSKSFAKMHSRLFPAAAKKEAQQAQAQQKQEPKQSTSSKKAAASARAPKESK